MLRSSDDIIADCGQIVRSLRERRRWSRGQAARRLGVSPAILYNIESGRSRAKLPLFFALMTACALDPGATLERFLFSVKETEDVTGAALVRAFRQRMKLTQRELASRLGYRSAAMIHHFEKGLRAPDLGDLLRLMELAGDDARGFLRVVTGGHSVAENFAPGKAATRRDWSEYWRNPHAAAIRQLMRTNAYARESDFVPGRFAAALGISDDDERTALEMLEDLGVVKREGGRPVVDPTIDIVIPKDVPRAVLDGFKTSWIDFMQRRYVESAAASTDTSLPKALCSIDLIPVNRKLYETIVERIRSVQDELHNLRLADTDGFASLGWLGSFVPLRRGSIT